MFGLDEGRLVYAPDDPALLAAWHLQRRWRHWRSDRQAASAYVKLGKRKVAYRRRPTLNALATRAARDCRTDGAPARRLKRDAARRGRSRRAAKEVTGCLQQPPLNPRIDPASSVPDLDAGAIKAYALRPDVRLSKRDTRFPDRPDTARRREGDGARSRGRQAIASVKARPVSVGWSDTRPIWSPRSLSGELCRRCRLQAGVGANRAGGSCGATCGRGSPSRPHGQDEQARLCRAQAMDKAANALRRWLRSSDRCLQRRKPGPDARAGADRAAVLGYDPAETPEP